MALKQILISRKIAELESEKKTLAEKITETAARRAAWKVREAQAIAALDEMDDNTTEEERTAFKTEADEIEREDGEITSDEQAHAKRSGEIDTEINTLKAELAEIEKRSAEAERKPDTPTINTTKREVNINMRRFNPEYRERCVTLAKEPEMKEFCRGMRDIAQRGITNISLSVPTVALPLLQQKIDEYSKLTPYVDEKPIRGEGRQNLLAAIPEAVWVESSGSFSELDTNLAQVRMDGGKVVGYIPVPNPYLEDADEDLAAIIMDMLGQSIGLAKDKAILYGNGTNMPVGIATRLLASTKPAWWDDKMPEFTNLSATNIGKATASSTGLKLMQEAFSILGLAKPVYNVAGGGVFWAMNPTTWTKIKVETMSFNAAGAVVAGVNAEMPVIGGAIVPLDFIPAGVIIGGYGSHYEMGQRRNVEVKKSEHARFIEDQTVFAASARYDGKPLAGEAFAAFSIDSAVAVTNVAMAKPKGQATE